MHFSQIRDMDISNGEGIGISLFVSGCKFHCFNCFNKETWDYNYGNEWNKEVEDKFFDLSNKDYIKRISILGGSPLMKENIETVSNIILRIKKEQPNKKIWLYTGFTLEVLHKLSLNDTAYSEHLRNILKNIDILVDGQYVDSLKDLKLKYRGSKNQRVINMKKTIEEQKIVTLEGV